MTRLPRWVRALLGVPLFYKILVANAAIVVLGAVAGTVLARELLRPNTQELSAGGLIVLLSLAGVALTVLVNALLLRVALSPLKLLEETAMRVQAGDLDARVPDSPLRDRQLGRLAATFNAMLDNLESFRFRLREVAARALDAEEEERKRIARELHDDTAQTLAALLVRLRLARSLPEGGERAAVLEEFRGELVEAMERVRRFARGLRPPALDDLGLAPALESHVRGLGESIGPVVRVDAEPLEGLLSAQAELALYRIAQESISNAIRHADATQVSVRLTHGPGEVVLRVTDDGRGFEVEQVTRGEGAGLGLFGMQERAAYVGGRVEIRSRRGAGTEVRAEVPVAHRSEVARGRGGAVAGTGHEG